MSGEKEKERENTVEKLMKHFAVDLIQEQEEEKQSVRNREGRRDGEREVCNSRKLFKA